MIYPVTVHPQKIHVWFFNQAVQLSVISDSAPVPHWPWPPRWSHTTSPMAGFLTYLSPILMDSNGFLGSWGSNTNHRSRLLHHHQDFPRIGRHKRFETLDFWKDGTIIIVQIIFAAPAFKIPPRQPRRWQFRGGRPRHTRMAPTVSGGSRMLERESATGAAGKMCSAQTSVDDPCTQWFFFWKCSIPSNNYSISMAKMVINPWNFGYPILYTPCVTWECRDITCDMRCDLWNRYAATAASLAATKMIGDYQSIIP